MSGIIWIGQRGQCREIIGLAYALELVEDLNVNVLVEEEVAGAVDYVVDDSLVDVLLKGGEGFRTFKTPTSQIPLRTVVP